MEKIQHFSHRHELTFVEDSMKEWIGLLMRNDCADPKHRIPPDALDVEPMCEGCYRAVDNGGYFCETCPYFFWLHKSCSLLPRELQNHPLHSSHPLILMAEPPPPKLYKPIFALWKYFICDECRDLCRGFAYHCAECQFYLDAKCALSIITDDHGKHHHHHHEMYHPSHIHQLIFFNSSSEEYLPVRDYNCGACEMKLQGPLYGCFDCEYFLHKSCAEMPLEIQQHPYHPQHPLLFHHYDGRRGGSKFICDGCRCLSSGFVFECQHCQIKLDVKCALLTKEGCALPTKQGSLGKRSEEEYEMNTQIFHFSHDHTLLLCNNVKDLKCNGCGSMISGLFYGCLDCGFYLHKSCAEMPVEIKHSYHPLHPLRAHNCQFLQYVGGRCAVCKYFPGDEGIIYNCFECDSDVGFTLHLRCAQVSHGVAPTPALKHNCHKHSLYYFLGYSTLLKYGNRWDESRKIFCDVCANDCMGPSYICLECTRVFHLECIPIPQVVFKPDSHMHSLTLREPLVAAEDEDDSKDYYCFACERERNPKHHAYYCDQCPYEAHIECMVSEFVDEEFSNSAWTSNYADEKKGVPECPTIAEYSVPRCRRQLQIGDFSKDHNMIKDEISNRRQCYVCKIDCQGTAYTCEFCNISFHRFCVELPPKIRHTLHLLHPLIFFTKALPEYFKCDGCATISWNDKYYRCEECKFILDIECASKKDRPQSLEERDGNAMLHFSHSHELLLANCPEYPSVRCCVCLINISGPAYCCLDCKIFIHESCSKVERVIHQNPFHPQHPLVWTDSYFKSRCRVCNIISEYGFVYHCSKCSFFIHYTCSKYLSSTLRYKNHEHSLFYIVAKDLRDEIPMETRHRYEEPKFLCKVCKNDCNGSFYRCLDCDLNLHLQCIPTPQKIKGAFHMHPVTLMDSVVQDYFDEQYCYFCEDVRNPNHAVYSCEECIYIAHIGCVLDEVDDSLQIFPSSVASPHSGNLRIEFGETSGEVDCEVVHLTDSVKESKKKSLAIVEVDKEMELLEQEMQSMKSN